MVDAKRVTGWLAAASFVVLSAGACAALDGATANLDKAQVCTKAIAAAGYTPDWSDPDNSAAEADDRAEQLRELANSTADANLQRELQSMASHLDGASATDAAEWTKRKAEHLDAIRAACS